jgi:acetyl esterase/lipase
MQAIISKPHDRAFNDAPNTPAEWKARVAATAQSVEATLPALQEALDVTVSPVVVAGVSAFTVTPASIPQKNRDKLLIHMHGGTRVSNPGLSGTREAIIMAGFAGYKVVSVDYRMPPDFPFPAALDDSTAVYREMLKTTASRNIGLFGFSAGGSLVVTTLLRAKAEGLPLPGAIGLGSPTVDLTDSGDTLYTNDGIDNVLGTRDGFIRATVALYAEGQDLTNPLLSPIYGDVTGFPPAILTSGTRDLYLSNTVRMHRKLRATGVEAILQVWEGQSHGQFMADITAPETKEYHDEVAAFLSQHLR